MNEHDSDKKQPSHRVSFARTVGQDENGKPVLGAAREIGAIWPRPGKEGEGILRFDHIPEELRNHGGVVFISKLDALTAKRGQPKTRDLDNDHGRDR